MMLFVLAACNDKENVNEEINESTVGFEVLGGEIKEAKKVPDEEKKAIEAAFAEYIAAFNAEDLNRYMATVSKNPKGFDYEEDQKQLATMFKQFDDKRQASDVTIVKYTEQEAQVFANLEIERLEQGTNTALNYSGRQVTVFVKEDGAWKVTSVYFIGNDSNTKSQGK